jgi:hypothetical protein
MSFAPSPCGEERIRAPLTEQPTFGERLFGHPASRWALMALAAGLLIAFPAYHLAGVSANAIDWGIRTAWGPATTLAGDKGPLLIRFGDASRVDQGVTLMVRHPRTHRLRPGGRRRLVLTGTCEPAPCTLEVRVEHRAPSKEELGAIPVPPTIPPGTKPPWVRFGAEPGEQSLGLDRFLPEVATEGVVSLLLVRTESVREADGEPRARTLRISGAEFRR